MTTSDLVDYLEDRAGEYLRGVVQYNDSEIDTLYLRDDIREERLRSQIDRMIERLQPESSPREERAFPFGDLYVTMRRFDEAIVLHFPLGRKYGTVVALEPETATNLNMFTDECLRRIKDM